MERALISLRNEPNYDLLNKTLSQLQLQIDLLETVPSITTMEEAKAEYEKTMEELARPSMAFINKNMDASLSAGEEKTKLQKKPAYIEASKMYDMATVTPVISAGSDQFKNFWTNPEYGVSTSDKDESKNLFFSILREKTKNFKDDFILGSDFGEDAEENKKRFPFIYVEWLKSKGIVEEEITVYDKRVKDLESRVSGIRPVHKIVEAMVGTSYQVGLNINKYKSAELKISTYKKGEYEEKGKVLAHYIYQLKEKIHSEDDDVQLKNDLQNGIDDLELHKQLVDAQYENARHLAKEGKAQDTFTRSSLKKNPQLVMELAMRQFHEAMTTVDKQYPHGNWKTAFNPTIRRLLIANIYNSGVSEFRIDFETGDSVYVDNLKADSRWMLSKLSNSPHYSRGKKEEAMDDDCRKLLPIAHLGNKINNDLKHYEGIDKALDATIKWKSNNTTDLSGFPEGMIKIFKKQNLDALKSKKIELKKLEDKSRKFLAEAIVAINNPYSKNAIKLITAIKNREYSEEIITPEMLKEYEIKMRMVETGYNVLEFNEEDQMDFMEKLGLNMPGVYEAYQATLNTKPPAERYEYSVDNWDNLRASPDPKQYEKLIFMLDKSLGKSDKKGKEHFLRVLKAMHGEGSETLDGDMETSKVHAGAIFMMIKQEIRSREKGYALSADQQEEYFAKLNGETLADKGTRAIKGVVNMLVGPGQSWANRGAGLIILIAALKAAHSAYKGDTKTGKALRLFFIAGAAELAVKEVTGKGLAERLGFETVMGAGEGTSEAVLVLDGEAHMKDKMVGPEEQTRALYELRKVPFNETMAWYMDTNTNKENGMPIDSEKDDKFPDGIDLSNIVIGEKWKNYDPDKAGKKVLMQTMKHFFEFVGRKNGLDHQKGAEMLKERWVDSLKPNYNPKDTRFSPPPGFIDKYKKKPDELTWGLVIDMEISQKQRDETMGTHGAVPVIDYFAERGAEFVEWSRQTLLSPATLAARRFGEKLGDNKDKFMKFMDELADKGKTKIHFGIEGAKLKWEEHEIEIRNFFGNNVELIWEGVKFFPSTLIALNQWAVPALLTKIKQGKEILFEDQIPIIEGETLSASDIVSDDIMMLDDHFRIMVENAQEQARTAGTPIERKEAIEQIKNTNIEEIDVNIMSDDEKVRLFMRDPRFSDAVDERVEAAMTADPTANRAQVTANAVQEVRNDPNIQYDFTMGDMALRAGLNHPRRFDVKENPSYKYFGLYQRSFMKAIEAKNERADGAMYFETPNDPTNIDYPDSKVGYLITETTQKDAEIMKYGEDDVRSRYSKMAIKAREQALDFFMQKGGYNINRELLETMMFPIHVAVKPGKYTPEVRYTFWRMPIPGGSEFELKASDHWADKMDPNKHKHRPPFVVDPRKGTLGNLQDAASVNSPTARKAYGLIGKVASQATRMFITTGESVGSGADSAINFFTYSDEDRRAGEDPTEFFTNLTSRSPEFKEGHDEISASASDSGWALSPFYHDNPRNAITYRALRDFAIERGEDVYLGPLNDFGRTSRLFDDPWDNWSTEEWNRYYLFWCDRNNFDTDTGLRTIGS